jgi:hypothetical protein
VGLRLDTEEAVMALTRRSLVAAGAAVGATGLVAAAAPPSAHAAMTGTIVLVTPQRILDSRLSEPTKYGSGAVDAIAVPGIDPYNGVIVNLTVTDTEGSGFVTLGKAPVHPPATSNINWSGPGITLANLAIINTGTNAGGIVIQMEGGGAAHLIIDLVAFIA